MPIKIAMIGAGSVGFTRRLMYDILSVPELADTHFSLMDISQRNLDMIYQLSDRDVRANKQPARVEATLDRRAAIADADYVISTIRQGGLEAFHLKRLTLTFETTSAIQHQESWMAVKQIRTPGFVKTWRPYLFS
jgi:alpha-galactosidase/6-phospho-beta-glucosidase family protein